MPENEPPESTKDAMPPDAATALADRHKKHLARHLAAGHGLAVASALATQDCMAEDEATESGETGEGEPDADDAGKALGEKRNIPQSERDKMPAREFAGPNQSFPIAKPEDIAAAAHLIGKADNPDAVKARIIAIAKKRGWEKYLPAAWDKEATEKPGAPDEPDPKKKSFDEQLRAGLKALGLLKDESDETTGFKVVGNHWLAVYSNNFKDRDGEFFPEREIDNYIRRVDMGIVPKPELQVWHAGKATTIGSADWVDRHGHFTFAAGQFYGGEAAQTAKAYYAKHARETGISHGFTHPSKAFDGRSYHGFNTFEISLLPRGAEANWYTSLEGVKELQVDEKKKQYLETVFGKEHAERILNDWDKRGKALEELNVEFKDFVATDDGAILATSNKEAVDLANKSLVELFPDLMEGSAESVIAANEAVKVAKAEKAARIAQDGVIADLQEQLKAIRAELNLKPRAASTDAATRMNLDSKDGKVLLDKLDKQLVERDSFWGTEVPVK